MCRQYKLGFDIGGLVLFLLIMLPNFIWFAVPAPNDVLRGESITDKLDTIASVCQVCIVAALCFVRRRGDGKPGRALPVLAGVCVLLYYACWLAYYLGSAGALTILGLTFPPCLAFLLYAISRKNIPAAVPACLFTLLHGVYAVCNFLL